MGKSTDLGWVEKDHPMFTEGFTMFSHRKLREPGETASGADSESNSITFQETLNKSLRIDNGGDLYDIEFVESEPGEFLLGCGGGPFVYFEASGSEEDEHTVQSLRERITSGKPITEDERRSWTSQALLLLEEVFWFNPNSPVLNKDELDDLIAKWKSIVCGDTTR